MGRMTIDVVRTELVSMTGNSSISPTRVDAWFHFALDEITGSIDFEKLLALQSTSTIADTVSYAMDAGAIGISSIYDITNKKRLLYTPPKNFTTLAETTDGPPKIYTRYGGNFHIWPTPQAVYSLKIMKRTEHDTVTTGETTDIPAQWDPALLALTAHYAFGALEEIDKSAFWFNRAMSLLRSRSTDHELDSQAEGLPVMVVNSYEDLMALREDDFTE